MAKQLNVNLGFTADTSQAKTQINQLTKTLQEIQSKPATLFDDANLKRASQAASELQKHLQSAFDVNTGKLDLSKFSNSLVQSKKTLSDYHRDLTSLGPDGQKAFLQLSQSIASADAPMLKMNSRLQEFATTLKNTARWQISSSILHGFMGTLQSAYGYAKDLDESLTNIRIVTGQSADQMADFAAKANKAAQSLSASTTAYTDAALIFYQQGLSDKDVEARTNATIKMAHATGDSAEDVSSYMTAIWNNFAEGSDNLEHFADVITALGASTASSSSEIASGLQQFAAIAETTGLSYEYATSALATLVANTRQSADTVGNSLKTIFSRLQGLSLGETLDDGTNLNKYSKALKTVGVDILDANGNLMQMDDILESLAGKWDNISQAQKMALAQTVAGTRQYTYLMSLMDNWDDMQTNLDTANDADGTLQQQADIYADSWEAARNRVKAAAQEIYGALIDENFFKGFDNGFAVVLNRIADFIDGMGGLKGIIGTIGGLLMQVFAKEAPIALGKIKSDIDYISGKSLQMAQTMQAENSSLLSGMDTTTGDAETNAQIIGVQKVQEMKQNLIAVQGTLNKAEREAYENEIEQVEAINQIIINKGKQLNLEKEIANKTANNLKNNIESRAKQSGGSGLNEQEIQRVDNLIARLKQLSSAQAAYQTQVNRMKNQANVWEREVEDLKEAGKSTDQLKEKISSYIQELIKAGNINIDSDEFLILKGDLEDADVSVEDLIADIRKLAESTGGIQVNLGSNVVGITDLDKKIESITNRLISMGANRAEVENLNEAFRKGAITAEDYEAQLKQIENKVTSIPKHTATMSEAFVSVVGAAMSLSGAINSIKSFSEIMSDEDATVAQKITAILAVLSSVAMAYTALQKSAIVVQDLLTAAKVADIMATEGLTKAEAEAAVTAGPLLPIILAIVAAIAAVVAIVIALSAAWKAYQASTPEGKLKAAQEEANALAESLDEAKNSANELKSAFDEYESILDKLNSCTKGTEEWSEALAEASTKTTELLQKYPQLLSAANLFDENGLLNIDVLQAELNNANSAVDALSAATLMAQTRVNEANVNVAKKNFAESNSQYTEYTDDGGTYTNYSKANKDLQTLLDTYQITGNATLELSDAYSVLGINMDTATTSEQQLANSLLELANQSISASNSIDNATQSIVNSWAASENINLETGQSALMSVNYKAAYNDIRQAVIDADNDANMEAHNKDHSSMSEYEGKSVWDLYNEARGTNYSLSGNGIQGTDNNRYYEYIDDDHNKHTVSLEEIANTIAASKALEELGDSAENASDILSNIDKTVGEEIGSGIKNWISSGNFESMNEADFKSMAENLEKDGDGNYTQESVEEYLKNALGVDDIASVLGDDWYTKFNSAALNFSTALDHITDSMSENAEKAYNSIKNLDKMSLGDQQQIAGLIQKSYFANGTEGANALAEQINSAIDRGATSQDITDFTTVLNGLDWDTASIADFRNALINANIDVDKFGIDINEIFDTLSNSSSQSLSVVQENYKAIQDIIKDLKTGSTISDEDYQTLVNQLGADAMDGYFSTMADGTHQLIGDAEEFYNAITENSRQQMLSNISDSSQLAGSLESTSASRMNNGSIMTQETSDAAVAYLKTLQLTEEETAKLAEVQDQYNQTGEYTAESFSKLNELMAEHNITEEQYNNLIIQNNQAIRENSEALLSTATSLAELDGLTSQVMANNNGIAYGYSEALIKLGVQYENCTNEIEDYQKALKSGNKETIAAAESALKLSITVGELSEKYDLNADVVETQAKLLQKNRKELKMSAEEAARLAVANQRLNRGVSTLNENIDDWKKTLNSTDHTTADYAETLTEAYDALADLTGALDASSIPLDFLDNTTESGAQHLEWFEQAAQGNVQAIDLLGNALGYAAVEALEFNENMVNALSEDFSSGFDDNLAAFENYRSEILEGITSLQEEIMNGTITAGDNITSLMDGTGASWVDSLNQMALATGMSVEEMNALLNQLGVQAKVTVQDVPQTMSVPTYTEIVEPNDVTVYDTDSNGQSVPVTRHGWTHYTVPGPSKEVEGYAQVAQISTEDGEVGPPQIQYVGTNGSRSGGGVSPSSTSGRGGRNRGSGSRGRETRARDRSDKDLKRHRDIEGNLKDLKDEIERYHEINNTIDDVNERLKDYDTIAERAFGKSKVNAINKQVKAYKELANTLGKKLNENAQYLDQDKSDAKSYGWKFDKNGNVSNYDERMAELVAQNNAAEERYLTEYNQAVAWWNSLSGDAQSEEGNKKKFENMTQQAEDRLEDAQKLYDKSVESLKTYEETVELREDLLREQQEAINNAIDKELEAVDTIFQTRIKVNEADIKLLDELISNLGEGADAAADAIGRMGEKMKYLSNETYAARDGIQSILEVYKDKDLFGDNALSQNTIDRIINGTANEDDLANILAVGLTEDTIDKLQDYQNQLYETNESMRQLREDALEKTSEAFTEYTDTLGKTSEKITHLQKVTTTYKNIIDIVGKKIMDSTGDLTNQLSRSNWELQRNNTQALKSELNFIDESMNNMKSAIAELQANNADGVHDVAIKNMQKQLQDMEETRDSTYESWLDSWEAEVQAAADIYKETLDNIVENFQDSLGGLMGSLDALSEAYSRKSEIDDIYVDDYEKIYSLSKLTRDIEKSIDDTDNIKSKQALRDLLEEMNELQEDGVELSSYDLENARRRYELELAKQKLQEAQEAKSQVRMTRDSEGNYGYVYTADESAVADAEQNYEDKLYEMQKANSEYIQELQNNIISAQQNCADALANLDATQFASYEEFQAAVAQVQEDYNALMEGYYQQINTALDNNQDLYNTEWQEYSDMTGYKISADEDYVDKFDETTYSILTGYETLQDAQNAWTESVIDATNAASEAWFRWYEDNQIALSDGETSMQDYASTVSDVTDTVLDLGEQMEQKAEDLATSYTDSFHTILDALQDFAFGYDSQIEKIISSNNQLQESINKVIRAASNLADATDKDGNTKTNNNGNGSSGNGGNGGNGNGSSGDNGSGNGGAGSSGGGKASWDRGYAAYKRINAGAWGNGLSNRISKGAKEGFTEAEVRLGQQIINYTYPPALNGKGYSLDKAKSLLGYDTGGYTGAWGNSDGKLALLHQKELVLNADDTENFLKAVDIIRDISQTIDLNALSASNSLATMLKSASTSGSNDSQVLEQEVHITADFSGVKDRGEIEAAFDNLINRAAQFANRKN